MKLNIVCAAAAILAMTTPAQAGFEEWVRGWFSKPPVDYGKWLCENCAIPSSIDYGNTDTAPADINDFIQASNYEIHQSKNEKVHRWLPGSVITVCNGTTCLTVRYPAMTKLWLPATGPVPDNGAGYKGRGRTPTNSPGSGGNTQSLIEINFIGPVPRYDVGAVWTITARYTPPEAGPAPSVGTGRWLTPSITLIQGDSSYTSVGTPFFQSPPEQVGEGIGGMLSWTDAAYGLEGGYGSDFGGSGSQSGCGSGTRKGCLYEN